jgi:hypothetical protein
MHARTDPSIETGRVVREGGKTERQRKVWQDGEVREQGGTEEEGDGGSSYREEVGEEMGRCWRMRQRGEGGR